MPRPYRLFLDEAGWRDLPAKLSDPFFAARAADNRLALAALRQLPVDQTPRHLDDLSSPPITLTWRGHKNRLQRGAVAWWLERDEGAADLIRATVDALLAEQWGPYYTNCQLRFGGLRTGDIAYCCAFACDVVPEVLGPERVAALMQRIIDDLVPRYFDGIEQGDWWARAAFNWGPAMHGNMGLIGLLIEEEHPALAARVLRAVRSGLQLAIDFFPHGGGWTEGPMYLQTTVGHLSDFAIASIRCHDDDLGLTDHAPFRDTFDYRMHAALPDGGFANFSNCNERTVEFGSPHAYFWAQRCDRPDWTAFEDRHVRHWRDAHGLFYDVESFWLRPADPALAEPRLRRHLHSSGLDWVLYRGRRIWFALRAGYNGDNHNHHDLGHLILGHDQTRWLCDAGYGAGRTAQHNCPTFAGEQCHCATAPILRQQLDDDHYYAWIDCSQAFPFHLQSYHRHLLVLDETHVVIIDEAHGRNGRRCGASFQLQTRAAVAPPGCGPIVLEHEGRQAWLQRINNVGVGDTTVTDWEHAEQALRTIAWRELIDRSDVVHVQVMSFSERAPACILDINGDRLDLRIDQRRVVIDLRQGACEVGP